jgi:hypothetical protein
MMGGLLRQRGENQSVADGRGRPVEQLLVLPMPEEAEQGEYL